MAELVKNPPAMREIWGRSLGWKDPLEKGKATHSSILAWRTPWTIESMGSQRVGHAERLALSLSSPVTAVVSARCAPHVGVRVHAR